MNTKGWIGVDLDGCLAQYGAEPWDGISIGPPVPKMVARVKQWLAEGIEVRIMTARVAHVHESAHILGQTMAIYNWCYEHLGAVLTVTAEKDHHMIELWDDRARQVNVNTGVEATFTAYWKGRFARQDAGKEPLG